MEVDLSLPLKAGVRIGSKHLPFFQMRMRAFLHSVLVVGGLAIFKHSAVQLDPSPYLSVAAFDFCESKCKPSEAPEAEASRVD